MTGRWWMIAFVLALAAALLLWRATEREDPEDGRIDRDVEVETPPQSAAALQQPVAHE